MIPPLQVLLVEDDFNVRLGCEQAMQLAGIPVTGVASAEEAERLLRPDFPGVVVTDMRLPGADGMTLLKRINALDANLPVIIITGHGDVTLAVEAMRNGAYDFMQKPFRPPIWSRSSAVRSKSARCCWKSNRSAAGSITATISNRA